MSYAEFPGTCMGDGDKGHAELIALYKELVSKYSETLGMIKETNDRLTLYENTMNQRISAAVTPAVNSAVGSYKNDTDNSIAQLRADNTNIRNIISEVDTNLTIQINTLEGRLISALETVDGQISTVNSRITQSNSSINNRIDSEIVTINNRIDSEIASINNKIETIEEEVSDAITQEREFTVRMLSILENKFEEEIAQIRDETSANSIRWLWQYGCYAGGFSSGEWYFATNITCGDWQKISPTADEWYTMGKHLFKKFDQSNKMFDPVTGRLSDVRRVIENMSILMKDDAITAEEYDKRNITAGHYNALNEKAFCYDWKGEKNVQ